MPVWRRSLALHAGDFEDEDDEEDEEDESAVAEPKDSARSFFL